MNQFGSFKTSVLLFVIGVSFSLNAVGDVRSFLGPRAISLSTALRGAVALNESIYLNPASAAFTNAYSLELGFLGTPAQGRRKMFNLSVIDTKTSDLGAGLSYVFSVPGDGVLGDQHAAQDNATSSPHSVRLAISYPIFPKFGVGISGSYLLQQKEVSLADKVSLNIGFLAELFSGFYLGGVFHDITYASGGAQRAALGMRARLHKLVYLSEDIVKSFSSADSGAFSSHTGLEVMARKHISVRVGYAYDQAHRVSFGGGWTGGKTSVYYGTSLALPVRDTMEHSLALRVVF